MGFEEGGGPAAGGTPGAVLALTTNFLIKNQRVQS